MHRRTTAAASHRDACCDASGKCHGAPLGGADSLDKHRRRRRKPSSKFVPDDELLLGIILVAVVVMIVCCVILLVRQSRERDMNFWTMIGVATGIGRSMGKNLPGSFMFHRKNGRRNLEPLKPSTIYRIPEAMDQIGDKSDEYAQLRKSYDEAFPEDLDRTREAAAKVRKFDLQAYPMNDPSSPVMPYDIHDCPEEPPAGYPFQWKTLDILKAWGPDDANVPENRRIHQGLCVFDYEKDLEKAMRYRTLELPFILTNDPSVMRTVERWNTPEFMQQLLGGVKHRCEYSENNHFLYWMPARKKPARRIGRKAHFKTPTVPPKWKQPTEMMRMTYHEWLSHANVTDDKLGPDQPHWYYRLIGCGETGPHGECDAGSSEYLFDELPFFQPREGQPYLVEYDRQRGIHCRFGMKGVIAENHFDGSRNSIAVLGGERRYILSHPDQCSNLSLLPIGHPSARHSAVNWGDPDLNEYPEFANARSNEVVLQAGDVLYLPTNWFHFIVSLSLNFQCNTRSGKSIEYNPPLHECGF